MSASEFKERLRADLKTAMRERNAAEAGVLRTLIAAVDNAEAVPLEALEQRLRQREAIGEIERRKLDSAALDAVLAAEAEARRTAASEYARHGRDEQAARLRDEAELVERYRR